MTEEERGKVEERRERPLRKRLELLYFGRSRVARAFRYGMLVFDIAIVAFFVLTTMIPLTPAIVVFDFIVAVVLLLDYASRVYVAERRWRMATRPLMIADILVIGSLMAPVFMESFAFLRVLRVLRLLRSYHVLQDLRSHSPFFARNQEVIQSVVNLFVFIFFVTALVYVLQARTNPAIETYFDALYFTVATLTTTGYGDITLEGDVGHVISVMIMVVGVGLFLRLVQTIFRPAKVSYKCPDCGLSRHEPDAVHCKHCGRLLHIETEGE